MQGQLRQGLQQHTLVTECSSPDISCSAFRCTCLQDSSMSRSKFDYHKAGNLGQGISQSTSRSFNLPWRKLHQGACDRSLHLLADQSFRCTGRRLYGGSRSCPVHRVVHSRGRAHRSCCVHRSRSLWDMSGTRRSGPEAAHSMCSCRSRTLPRSRRGMLQVRGHSSRHKHKVPLPRNASCKIE